MGFSPSSGPFKSQRRSFKPMSEINVTPMVDVMLVLLVIFMVSAPLMNRGVPVDLPSHAAPTLQEKETPLIITLTLQHQLFLGEEAITLPTLITTLQEASKGNFETRIYLRADQGLPYGEVMETMGKIREAGFLKIALVSDSKTVEAKNR